MIKAIIFDMDGVIIDSEGIYKKIEAKMYRDLGIEMTREESLMNMGMGIHNWWKKLQVKYQLKEDPEVLAEQEIQVYLDYLFDDEQEKRFMDGIAETLEVLSERGYRIGVASGSDAAAVDRVLAISGFQEYFAARITASDVVVCKPDPEIFLKAAEALEVTPGECLVIEDSYNGILAAKAAGMRCLAYTSAPEGIVDYSLADGLLHHHQELIKDFL
ncbi:MAG: HAD family phosphatase [Eubacterium aggregans]|uniref:Haloacid dehalogenase superfamily, subfamily IA, variant 3 with third motif having DD or ED/haloacid dehalogenase superfamily, subfamily IA, variant 1 with third motif having Dx(3-4)D or Dx(3-4)E n=1 Tax=Eubacterium aggregans TaxID=81409 RepID=A0A1H4B903_9FIRM|nr:HAD family phosphatase [Eubacterium aggregans]MDD4690620.1 HAD family phosphatase [Eubacterium aggregans]MEA5073140.1 HAD family phosphatase [Eubacterium aggregans]SEA44302.1 haloacid dehalogenase superfamily, subfamily IA, variant 3 with third motif having DD or ED/haloacid dehalogenase superfamily, subfamily IA, variant 1 with third motif having Dx(3-4)D or Dx(3-4)E [Eubacterium aggregans]